MKQLFIFLLSLPFVCLAQEKGIHFEHGNSWKQILAKAKAENKYIFMDCFTTWCGPCRYMTNTVFPQEKVGDYFNANFINVKVQLDTTASDNEEIKKWYADGHDIMTKYKIQAFPTFLFFAPNGTLVHRMVGGGEADQFIQRASNALDPSKQYYTLLKNFENGAKNPESIKSVAYAAMEAFDRDKARMLANAYLKTQQDLYTKDNIQFLRDFTNSIKDTGFTIFLYHPEKVNNILGKGRAESVVNRVIFREEATPLLFNKTVQDSAWTKLNELISQRYQDKAPEILAYIRVTFYRIKGDWANYQTSITEYVSKYGDKITIEDLNEYAWSVFQNCKDEACLRQALEWSKQTFKDKDVAMYIDTYANLLYKLGRKDEAIEWQKKAVAAAGPDQKQYSETLKKMEGDVKTWND
ncbi:thioredoxin fold domain-containing protein [Danxiaibacter flavus]|uniref:Thioredoxin fold domain-containing protein n=1 Tax=Danxiaibacter flavus TaxID=3049108 RepID=A0ABV3ZEE5_9BACT|nr:thioredoxin fold domain-containing protein [Chitinophagaceae bacterium DXS]